MNNLLIISQDGNLTCFAKSIAIGRIKENLLIGDKLKDLLKGHNMTLEDLIKDFGTSYLLTLKRVLNNEEIPKKTLINKLEKFFKLEEDYFKEKELERVLITDGGVVVARYKTNIEARETKKDVDRHILSDITTKTSPILIDFRNK